jgi:putative transposase
LDAIHYKVKEDGRYIGKAIYPLLGLTLEGKKEILGIYLSDNEGANYWLTILTDLHNRGLKDILIACIDGLTGFPEAIASIYPPNRSTVVYRPSNSQFDEICGIEKSERIYD